MNAPILHISDRVPERAVGPMDGYEPFGPECMRCGEEMIENHPDEVAEGAPAWECFRCGAEW